MTGLSSTLSEWIGELAALIEQNLEPDPDKYLQFFQDRDLGFHLLDAMDALDDEAGEQINSSAYSAFIFAVDVWITQLSQEAEKGSKLAIKTIQKLMVNLAKIIESNHHSLSYWLPILNVFYDTNIELSDDLKSAYLNSACLEDSFSSQDQTVYLNSVRELIKDLSDMSVFDIAENFFAQSYAMPLDFFGDLIMDLYSIEEGREIALLGLLHPKADVREVVVETIDDLIPDIYLSSRSLSRIQAISYWYPPAQQYLFNQWIVLQRKKGVLFSPNELMPVVRIQASEIDGSGAQGIFIQMQNQREHRLCGLLLKYPMGIKNAWITPMISAAEVSRYQKDVFDESVVMRPIDMDYLIMMVNHFLALMIERGDVPCLHVLAIQEMLGIHFIPEKIDIDALMQDLGIKIVPFTADGLDQSLKRTASWPENKRFAFSWFVESVEIDKLVNQNCQIVDGIKICRFEEAMGAVLLHYMECNRDRWLIHFLWNALWLKVSGRKNEKVWQDSYLIAYAIQSGHPLASIPIMMEICRQSVANSMETMQDRRTYLN